MIPKTVVFAPIPRTRARKATMEKAGYLTSIRKAKRRSFIIIVTPNVGLELGQLEWRGEPGSDTRAEPGPGAELLRPPEAPERAPEPVTRAAPPNPPPRPAPSRHARC